MQSKLALSSVFLLETLVIYYALAQRSPTSGDDYSYMYQAKLFASGNIYAQDPLYDLANPLHDCVATSCIKDYHGHRFSQYPPGWPALLAVGMALGTPWVVNPLLGALLVFLIFVYVERNMGKELVTVTWSLLMPCVFLAYYAGSCRAHIVTALFVFSAFFAYEAAVVS